MKQRMIFSMLLFLGLALPVFAQNQSAVRASIEDIQGTVEVKQSGDWVSARKGMNLDGNSVISTGFKSTALIKLGSSTLTVQPLSRLTLEELSAASDNEKVSVFLRAGRVRADVNPPPRGKVNFQVRSPSATASVRGTVFEFDGWGLAVSRGTVAFYGKDGSQVLVQSGRSSFLDGAGLALGAKDNSGLYPNLPIGINDGSGITGGTPASDGKKYTVKYDWYRGQDD
jgi:hypothetical protein